MSVLTPVYNGERHLADCIESVLSQRYDTFEHVIVNNRSTDGSREIAERYARKDGRVRIVDNAEFVGVIRNHNLAFAQAAPEARYCKLVHADDMLLPACLEEMVGLAEANPHVGLVGSYAIWGRRLACEGVAFPTTVISGREIARRTLLGELYLFLSPSSLLIRADLLRARMPYYDERYLHADVAACYDVLQTVDFGFVHQVLTYIRRHEDSITSSYSARVNSFMLSNLHLLMSYGPVYLSSEEYRHRLRGYLRRYYKFLAMNLLRVRDRQAFWKFHRDGLRQLGRPLAPHHLALGLAYQTFDIATNPRHVARQSTIVQRALARRRARGS